MTLEELCAARGLTLDQLAERAGVPLATVEYVPTLSGLGYVRVQP